MKKYVPYIVVAVVVIGGGGAYFLTKDKSTNNSADNAAVSSSKETASLKYADACKLFTPEELGSALGGTYGEGQEEYAPSTATPGSDDFEELRGSACKFEQNNDGSTTGMSEALDVSVAINNHKDVAAAKQYMEDLRNPQTAEGQEAVKAPVEAKGVGDEAFFVKLNVASNVEDKNESLNVRVGRQVVVITATRLAGVDHEAVQASLTKLAKKL